MQLRNIKKYFTYLIWHSAPHMGIYGINGTDWLLFNSNYGAIQYHRAVTMFLTVRKYFESRFAKHFISHFADIYLSGRIKQLRQWTIGRRNNLQDQIKENYWQNGIELCTKCSLSLVSLHNRLVIRVRRSDWTEWQPRIALSLEKITREKESSLEDSFSLPAGIPLV